MGGDDLTDFNEYQGVGSWELLAPVKLEAIVAQECLSFFKQAIHALTITIRTSVSSRTSFQIESIVKDYRFIFVCGTSARRWTAYLGRNHRKLAVRSLSFLSVSDIPHSMK